MQAGQANPFVLYEVPCHAELHFHQHQLSFPSLLGGIAFPAHPIFTGPCQN